MYRDGSENAANPGREELVIAPQVSTALTLTRSLKLDGRKQRGTRGTKGERRSPPSASPHLPSALALLSGSGQTKEQRLSRRESKGLARREGGGAEVEVCPGGLRPLTACFPTAAGFLLLLFRVRFRLPLPRFWAPSSVLTSVSSEVKRVRRSAHRRLVSAVLFFFL